MACIYIIENDINDKIYIGQTKHTAEERFKQHLICAHLASASGKLYAAIQNIGENHFRVRTLTDCPESQLNILEEKYIAQYDSFRNGYNSTSGGSGTKGEYEPEFLSDLLQDYVSNMSQIDLCSKYKISRSYLCTLTKGVDRHTKNDKQSVPTETKLVCYTADFVPMGVFETVESALNWIKTTTKYKANRWDFYREVTIACQIGNIAYGHRWQIADEITYDGILFRSKFDAEKYIATGRIKQIKNYFISPGALVGICNSAEGICRVCGEATKSRESLCEVCIAQERIGREEQTHNLRAARHRPSKEELESLLQTYNYTQLGKMFEVTPNCIKKWAKKYGIDTKSVPCSMPRITVIANYNNHRHRFTTIKEAARWLMQNGLINWGSLDNIAYKIGIAAKQNTTFSGVYWETE